VSAPRRPEHLLRFASLTAEFQKALKVRGRESAKGRAVIAEEIGVSAGTMWSLSTGRSTPSPTLVAKLADVLSWPRLVVLSEEIRGKECATCGQPFIDPTAELRGLYCSKKCRGTGDSRNKRESISERAAITKRQLARHRDAIGRFCRSCSPGGVCPDSKCELRVVSPLPLPRGQQWLELHGRAEWLRDTKAG